MSDTVQLLAVSPEAILYQGQVLWVQLPLDDGLLGVWPDHAPLIATLAAGVVTFGTPDGEQELAVEGGTVRIDAERCVLLVGAPSEAVEEADRVELFEEATRVLAQELEEDQRQEVGL